MKKKNRYSDSKA